MFDFGVDGLGKNVIVGGESKGELEMKKYELSAFVNFDNCFESQFPVGGEVGALNRVYGHLKGMCASGANPLIYGMQYVWVFYSDRIEKVARIVADYSFTDYRLQGLWFFDEEHCFKDACN